VSARILDIVTERPPDAGETVFYVCWIDCTGKHGQARRPRSCHAATNEVRDLQRKYPETRYFIMRETTPEPPRAAV